MASKLNEYNYIGTKTKMYPLPNCLKVFTSPEEHPAMHSFLVNQTLREKDNNGDGLLDFREYVGERGEDFYTILLEEASRDKRYRLWI